MFKMTHVTLICYLYMKFPTNRFVENLCHSKNNLSIFYIILIIFRLILFKKKIIFKFYV
jgi:hypothetical protein